jgi:two-component system KDP operon response regulator KdpE
MSSSPAFTPLPGILLVDDDPQIGELLVDYLEGHGFRIAVAANGSQMRQQLGAGTYDLVLLDLGLPGEDGLTLVRWLRERWHGAIIILTGRGEAVDRVVGLELGADDYVAKPFSMEELVARLRAALRRGDAAPPPARVRIGSCEVDLAAHTVLDGTGAVRLTRIQWQLLEILLRHPGQLVSTQRLLTEIWGPGHERSAHYLRFHMSGLRRKLEADPSRPRYLLTEPGMGYRYQP